MVPATLHSIYVCFTSAKDALLLKFFLLGTVAGKLQHLRNKILKSGGHVNSSVNPYL